MVKQARHPCIGHTVTNRKAKTMHRTTRCFVRLKHTLPLVETPELLSRGISEQAITTSLRDYMELINTETSKRSQRSNEGFFTPKNRVNSHLATSLQLYQPLLSHCLSRWLLVDYKLNFFPYYDLNIVQVYTDLQQSISVGKLVLDYFRKVFPQDIYNRVNYYLVSLYGSTEVSNLNLPEKMQLIPQGTLSTETSFFIEDPVYVLMLNDVIRYLSQDVVLRNEYNGSIEQCYIDLGSNPAKRFDSMDYWCELTCNTCSESLELKFPVGQETYIPTRMVQLFHVLKHCVPEHRLFALDLPQRYNHGMLNRLHRVWNRESNGHVSKVNLPFDIFSAENNLEYDKHVTFIPDFTQIKQLYNSVNDGTKVAQFEGLHEFAKKWMDLEESERIYNNRSLQLPKQLLLEWCPLGILHG